MTPEPRKCTSDGCETTISAYMPFCPTHMAWRCTAHDLTTTGDCPKCDDEMIGALERSERMTDRRDELGHCHTCGYWKAEHCNVDGFAYCASHYPDDLR